MGMGSNGARALLLVLGLAPGTSVAWYSGTPAGVPPSFDCAARALAYTYGRQLAPHRGQFKSLYDALQVGLPSSGVPCLPCEEEHLLLHSPRR